MGMQYEEGLAPEDAVTYFAKPLKTRLLNEYHDRLGGAWNSQGSTEVAVWLRDVRRVRNLVAHAGYLPHQEEADKARKSYVSLGRHLRNRLAVRVKDYPFTSGLLVTQGGFERRDIRSKAAQDAVRAASDGLDEFLGWRDRLIELRAESARPSRCAGSAPQGRTPGACAAGAAARSVAALIPRPTESAIRVSNCCLRLTEGSANCDRGHRAPACGLMASGDGERLHRR